MITVIAEVQRLLDVLYPLHHFAVIHVRIGHVHLRCQRESGRTHAWQWFCR